MWHWSAWRVAVVLIVLLVGVVGGLLVVRRRGPISSEPRPGETRAEAYERYVATMEGQYRAGGSLDRAAAVVWLALYAGAVAAGLAGLWLVIRSAGRSARADRSSGPGPLSGPVS